MNPKLNEEEHMRRACRMLINNRKIRKISENEIVINQENIGSGGQGEVSIATFEGKKVALKKLEKINWKGFAHEIIILSCVGHENIPEFYGIVNKKDNFQLVFQLIDGMDLRDLEIENINEQAKLRIAQDVCNALEVIHFFNIVHRDLKPENIMVDKTGKGYLIDFGISKILGEKTSVDSNAKGTYEYLAPEVYAFLEENEEGVCHSKISEKIDVWSFGLVLSYLFSGVVPWSNKRLGNDQRQILSWLKEKVAFPIPNQIKNEQIINIIKLATIWEKNERPTISEIKKLLDGVKL
jgi:serine/threonine protein kinase